MQELFYFIQAYASLTSTSIIKWPEKIPNEKFQQFLVRQLISSQHFKKYPPSSAYQRSFWKWIIQKLEEQDEEVDGIIYDHFLTLPSVSNSVSQFGGTDVQPPQASYITYLRSEGHQLSDLNDENWIENAQKCTLLEARTTIESGTTGLRTWTASLVLADFLREHEKMIMNARILELGSGVGFLGITVAQMQLDLASKNEMMPPSLCLTDVSEQVLDRCRHNIELDCNRMKNHCSLKLRQLDWSDSLYKFEESSMGDILNEANANVILGADLIYDVDIIPALVGTLRKAIYLPAENGEERKALIAATVRNEMTLEIFLEIARGAGLNVHEELTVHKSASDFAISNQPDAAGREDITVKIFCLTASRA